MKKHRFSAKAIALSALIAALYTALTALSALFGLAIGPLEIRFSEALVILPIFTPCAVPGLFCGCFLSNLLCGAALPDLIFGSLATLVGAIGTYLFRKKPLLPYLSPIVANCLVIPPILFFVYGFQDQSFPLLFLTFAAGEILCAGIFAYFLKRALLPFGRHFQ